MPVWLMLLAALAAGGTRPLQAQTAGGSSNRLVFDASRPVPPPETGYLQLGGKSANGHEIAVTSRYLMLDGKPWLAVMGEFHFSRYPESGWEDEILKMKAAGVEIVSTYVFWIHHEEVEGEFDWSGRRDLRRFVELCAKHGMYVYLRIGPWAHGEARNGGFPDWLLAKTKNLRRNDPVYLAAVEEFDGQIGKQVQGLLFKDGGPVIGVQLENEYGDLGPGRGAEHLQKLKDLAVAAGLVTPLYSATAWPNYHFPPTAMMPMGGGYPDGFWTNSLTDSPPKDVYRFNFDRSSGDMGAMTQSSGPGGAADPRHYPYATAESGAGMETAYHRRPLIRAEDITALTLTSIGSGVNINGYFMFQGGANPDGRRTSLEETQSTGYPNDLPRVSYDFQAPLGEFGQPRKSYFELKTLDLFLNEFGSVLAPMVPVAPSRTPKDAADFSVPRASLRARDGQGFLFVNNYVRQSNLPERKDFQAEIHLAGGSMSVPLEPVTIPANTYFIWPVNLAVGGAVLRYSTAQPVTRVVADGIETYVFFAVPGIAPEFLFDAKTASVRASSGQVTHDKAGLLVRHVQPGRSSVLEVTTVDGRRARVLVLSEADAERLWKISILGAPRVVLSQSTVLGGGDDRVELESTEQNKLEIEVLGSAGAGGSTGSIGSTGSTGSTSTAIGCMGTAGRTPSAAKNDLWTTCSTEVPIYKPDYLWSKLQDAGPIEPTRMGTARKQPVAEAPPDKTYDTAAVWNFTLSNRPPASVSELYLRITYAGDVARAYAGKHLIDDNFFNGSAWTIGLERFLKPASGNTFEVRILPARSGMPIYFDTIARQQIPATGQVAKVRGLAVIPEYKATIVFNRKQ